MDSYRNLKCYKIKWYIKLILPFLKTHYVYEHDDDMSFKLGYKTLFGVTYVVSDQELKLK